MFTNIFRFLPPTLVQHLAGGLLDHCRIRHLRRSIVFRRGLHFDHDLVSPVSLAFPTQNVPLIIDS